MFRCTTIASLRCGCTRLLSMQKSIHPDERKLEALRLYRECLRTANCFYWANEDGIPWSQVLKESARKEFEQARYETDPIIIARLLVVGHDCVMQTQQKFNEAEQQIKDKITNTRNDFPSR